MAIKATSKITVYDHTDTIKVVPWYYKQLRTVMTPPSITQGDMSPSGWSTSEPTVTSESDLNYKVYVAHQNVYGNNTCWWGEISLYSSYEAAIQAYNKAQSAMTLATNTSNYFWSLTSSTDTDIPSGVYVTSIPKTTFETQKTGGNIIIQNTGITIRNGTQVLSSLTGSALNFYNPSDNSLNAQLSSTGLEIKRGGISFGTSNTNNYVYISSENGPRVSINNYTPPDPTAQATLNTPQWREIIGTKFGVLSDGTLYASNVNISGAITVGSGSNVYTKTEADGVASTAEANASYSVEIEVSSIDLVNNNATLIAHPYFKGVKLTNSTTPALSTITGYTWTRADGVAIPSGVTTNAKTLQLPNNSDLQATYVCTISKT